VQIASYLPVSGGGSITDTEELDRLTWVASSETITIIATSLYPPVAALWKACSMRDSAAGALGVHGCCCNRVPFSLPPMRSAWR
jgi:hypothetical protein